MANARDLFDMLAPVAELGEAGIWAAICVFARIGAAATLLPGIGEQNTPVRVKLAAAICLTLVIWPAVAPLADLSGRSLTRIGGILMAEAIAGLMLGLSLRLLIIALQMAGTIASQSMSLSQMFGQGLTADPQPAYAHLLAISGIVLAFALGVHIHIAGALIRSYDVIPFGQLPFGSDAAEWGSGRIAAAFRTSVSVAAPFVVASFAYYCAIGAINKAMPQLMVAFVGAPAITGAAILLMMLATPIALSAWGHKLESALFDPLGFRG